MPSTHQQHSEPVEAGSDAGHDHQKDNAIGSGQVTPPARESSPPPPLPSRPDKPDLLTPGGSLRVSKASQRPQLQSSATTAVSRTDVHTALTEPQQQQQQQQQQQATGDPSTPTRRGPSRPASATPSRQHSVATFRRGVPHLTTDWDDNSSVRSLVSHAGTAAGRGEVESLLGDLLGQSEATWAAVDLAEDDAGSDMDQDDQRFAAQFASEFVSLDDLASSGSNDENLQLAWTLKLKHFLILTSAGKPIWTRHGGDQLVSRTIGIVQTLISFYETAGDTLRSFSAGTARFAVLTRGHLSLVAISRMPGEGDAQLRAQLEALYTQILSTLTLPTMNRMFLSRPSTDLRRPLQGTEALLSSLADSFTRGSPSTLLGALECLRLRKAHRTAVNAALQRTRVPELLYGLVVTGRGQLVSVLRPKKHSLHPADLRLVFNMLFEARGVRRAGGEAWVPLCLPGFNDTGFVYMYVAFLDIDAILGGGARSDDPVHDSASSDSDQEEASPNSLAILLISASPSAFESLQKMRDALVAALHPPAQQQDPKTKTPPSLLTHLSTALTAPALNPITPLTHYLYKSRVHVQYTQGARSPAHADPLAWRRLVCTYSVLHAAVHGRGAGRNKVLYFAERGTVAVAWVTAEFEFYGVAGSGASRQAVAQAAGRVVSWAKREEERLFVIGGAVF